ncbi:carbohydrate esterase family 1 protein [Clavulina sp. PMI_390]|nr:carbohydrate esterase family 1 protein [Clavulina sp. PMI_390]
MLLSSVLAAAVTCLGLTGASPLTQPTGRSAAAGVYTGGDTSGCGVSHWFPGIPTSIDLTSSGVSRSYLIHTPSNYSSTHQYPLILGFHGSSSVGFFFEADTGLDDAQYTGDKIMIYPNGLGGAWAGANYSTASVPEDLQFVWDLLADVRTKYCIDSARIYATGLSIGGGFVNTIACNDTVGGEFAAFSPASGSFYTDATGVDDGCTPARSVTPILEFHGGADADVFYNGGQGEGGYEPPIPTWLGFWAERNGCETPYTQVDSFNDDVHHLIWTCGGQYGALQHYKTDDQKHDWPSTDINFSQIAAGDLPTHISASAIIQSFFMNFTRPAA